MHTQLNKKLDILKKSIEGEIYYDKSTLLMYATDASAYREIPSGIIIPKNNSDIKKTIIFAASNKIPLIPRTAGTSLAGQVVGSGIVVDISKNFNNIIEINEKEKWVKVQPGVVLDELNIYLKQFGLFFGPETSTSNRCMIGGMVGNNSCGAHSLIYGSTRDHIISLKAFLSDGTEAEFGELTKKEFLDKCKGNKLENKIYQNIYKILSDKYNKEEIVRQYPDKNINRRNTGYALDILLDSCIFTDSENKFNFCKLIAGSEGTLCFITEIKLNLVPLPPKHKALICVHCNSLQDALKANLIALKHKPCSVELMDNTILELTRDNIEQNKNRFFIKGQPAAILIVEFARNSQADIFNSADAMIKDMQNKDLGYHFPVISGNDIKKVWNLRKAGLGVLSNMKGNSKPVPVIEDTAVNPDVLPEYIDEFQKILSKHNLSCVYYAHIATGELHLRPVLNLKDKAHVELFHTIALEVAKLVKKYKGSLSGEHGDGRLRGEFIPLMIGEHNYNLCKEIKSAWDPENIFNPRKITDTPKMNTSLRFKPGQKDRQINTFFDFSATGGIMQAVEKCNGSADCRKSEIIGGTMCPSFMASKNEHQSTRARANILREFLTNSEKENPFDHKEIYEVMDLCLSCKACKSECPSGVDIAKLKAEFLQHFYDKNGVPLRTKIIAHITNINRVASVFPQLYNQIIKSKQVSKIIKKTLGFAIERNMPQLSNITLNKFYRKHKNTEEQNKKVYLFNDEFINYNDSSLGIKTILLLNKLGYKVIIPHHKVSGRTFLSKGLVRKAKKIANKNIRLLKDIVSENSPLIGIEPSAILSFRDEYPELADKTLLDDAKKLAKNTFLIDEFLANEINKGNISKELFTKETKTIKLHGHCQQKAIASTNPTKTILSFPENYYVVEIPSGCCGMAGSFGYEKEHYKLSMKIGELILFPEIRKTSTDSIISATGISCRHQIKDGTNTKALHPVEILFDALL